MGEAYGQPYGKSSERVRVAWGDSVRLTVRPSMAHPRPVARRKADTVAARLRALREARGLSLHVAARQAGVGAMTLHGVEAGSDPKLSTLRALARAYGVTVGSLTDP